MAYKHKPGSGTIFKVDDKSSENYPDYKGKIVLADGEEMEIALWVKETDRGKYFSAKIQKPYKAPETSLEESNKSDDDLPF
tara:strand:- start:4789 stop:5031 length:243 start_codon:yes stop_codon:yes gene_type:complete